MFLVLVPFANINSELLVDVIVLFFLTAAAATTALCRLAVVVLGLVMVESAECCIIVVSCRIRAHVVSRLFRPPRAVRRYSSQTNAALRISFKILLS